MSAETLRRAAALMQEQAEAATEGTWRVVPVNGDKRADIRTEPELGYDHRGTAVATAADSEFGACPMRDAEHIASWHPAVALAVAKAMDDVAHAWEIADEANEGWVYDADDNHYRFEETVDGGWLAVAHAYLGEA